MGKYSDKPGSLALLRPVWEKDNFVFKPALPCLKIDLVSYPARRRGIA